MGNTFTTTLSSGDWSGLDATWGGASADSYLNLADAEELVEQFVLDTTKWDGCTDEKKAKSLRVATRRIDMHNYYGNRQTSTQSLQWPRCIGFCIDASETDIYTDVRLATLLEANDLVSKRGMAVHEQNIAAGLKQISESVGPIRDQYTYNSAGPGSLLCIDACRIMAKYIQSKRLHRA